MLPQSIQGSSAQSAEIPINRSPHGRFFELFSHPWNFITKAGETWATETQYPIQPANLWHCWNDENTIVGIRFGPTTRYALIDIDIESAYHPKQDPAALDRIRHALETIGIYRTLLVRSSDSEGLHLYIPLSEPVATFELARSLQYAITSAKLEIASGTLEIFPNAKRFRAESVSNYAGHRLPLQKGSYLLNSDCQPITNDLSCFLDIFEMSASCNSIPELENGFRIAKEHAKQQSFTQSGEPRGQRGKAWKADCERVIGLGWSAYHQTNQILGVIAQYGRVFKGLADSALAAFILETAISCPGYADFCRHQHEIEQRCKDWANSAQKSYTPYRGDRTGNAWSEQRDRKTNAENERRSTSAIERIKNAISEVASRTIATFTEWATTIAQVAKCSLTSIYRHKSLWPQEFVCNPQNSIVEADLAAEKAVESDTVESLEPVQEETLHTNNDYEGVGPLNLELSTKELFNLLNSSTTNLVEEAGRLDLSDRNAEMPPPPPE